MPWNPGPLRQSPYAMARVLGTQGLTEDQITDRLRRSFNVPGAPMRIWRESDFTRAAIMGHRWAHRIATLRAAEGDDARPLRSWSLVNKDIDEAYRYHVVFHLAPDEEGNETHRTIIINSSRRLSFAEMGDLAVTVFQDIHNRSSRLRNVYIDGATPFDLQLMERRSN